MGGLIGNVLETVCGHCGAGEALDQMHSNLGNPLDIPGRILEESMVEILGPALAAAIQQSRDNARSAGVNPIPPDIRADLAPYFDSALLDSVGYRVGQGNELSVQANSMRFGGAIAVALIDTIVFRYLHDVTQNRALWAHELTHIRQYRDWGLLSFAKKYVRDHAGVEKEAHDYTDSVIAGLAATGVHTFSAVYSYSRAYIFSLQTPTALHETDDTFDFAWLVGGDLMAIKKSATGSGATEVHVLSAASTYQTFAAQIETGLHETGPTHSFLTLPNRDLVVISKSGTGSGRTEFHILGANSGYKHFTARIPTAIHETGPETDFVVFPNGDIAAIIRSGTQSQTTEVHVLTAESQYASFGLQTPTALHETDENFDFVALSNRDIIAVSKMGTGTQTTEVHKLAAAEDYRTFSLQSGTALHETGPNFHFLANGDDDLVAIAKSETGSGKTELHIVDLP